MDEKLIHALEENARLSNEELAAMIGATPEAVAARLDELQSSGIIMGYRAIIDWEKAGQDSCAARIELKVTPKMGMGFEEIAYTVAQFDEVQSVYLMSGGYDLALTVTGKNFKDIAMFVAHRLAPLEAVVSTATHFVLKKYKEKGILVSFDEKDEREVVH